jgi:Glyoxalase/Bleomycin resistance protein/Dioxygenase superfamily
MHYRAVAQIAYAVGDVEAAAAAFAERHGAGPFFVRHHPPMASVDAAGVEGSFVHSSAYGQWGAVQVELVQIHSGAPAASGLHHVAWFVPSFDEEKERLALLGWPAVMTARSSSGSLFAFCDARADLGHLVEIYEPAPSLISLYDGVRLASAGWDGRRPVRPLTDITAPAPSSDN